MKVAILADIHGNLEALLAVSDDLRRRDADRVICLGDSIGYGPDPEEVVRQLRRLGAVSVLGNHECALTDRRARKWLNFQAEENNIVTAGLLSPESLAYCTGLPKFLVFDKAYFVHGYPPQSVFLYLNRQSDASLAGLLNAATVPLFFLGHTHQLQLVWQEDGIISRRALGRERLALAPGQKYIVNAGSVGQPRDGDHHAKYLLWDTGAASLEVLFVAYDFRTTMEKIKERGFPAAYAARLG